MTRAQEVMDELNRDNCVVRIGGKTRVMIWEDFIHEVNRERYIYKIPSYMTFRDFNDYYVNRLTVDENGVPFARNSRGDPKTIGNWWLTHPLRLTFKGVTFVPNGPPVIDDRVNLWRGFGVKPVKGDWGRMQEHIFEVLSARDDAVNEYVLNWLSFAVQCPALQAEVVLAFKGGFGTGKGILGRAMCRIFGPHGRHISDASHLTGKFNAHFQLCCFLFADEAFAPQDKRAEGVFKRLITEDTLLIEPKRIDAFEVDNHLKVMSASNHEWMVLAGEKERRVMAQEVLDVHQQDDGYFQRLGRELREGGREAMLHGLLDRSIGDWHPRRIVWTKALAKQQTESLSALDQWLFELLWTGVLPGADPVFPWKAKSNEYEEEIQTVLTDAYGVKTTRTRVVKRDGLYSHARKSSPRLKGVSDTAIGRYLRERGCENWRPTGDVRGWIFKSLPELRDEWVSRFPQTVWAEGTAEWGRVCQDYEEGDTAQIFDFPR